MSEERAWFLSVLREESEERIERDFLAGEIVACPRVIRSEPEKLSEGTPKQDRVTG